MFGKERFGLWDVVVFRFSGVRGRGVKLRRVRCLRFIRSGRRVFGREGEVVFVF